MIKTIILDFDGTIADTQRLILRSYQGTIRELGLPTRTDAECAATIGLPLKDAFMSIFDISDDMGNQCAATYRCLFDEYNDERAVSPFPHVIDTLKTLYHQGYQLTIATSRGRDSLMVFLDRFQLTPYISYIVTAEDTEKHKPHPEPVLKTLQHLQQLPHEALVVGDTNYDIGMGRNAGCLTCGVTYGNQTRQQLEDAYADYIIDDFSTLTSIL